MRGELKRADFQKRRASCYLAIFVNGWLTFGMIQRRQELEQEVTAATESYKRHFPPLPLLPPVQTVFVSQFDVSRIEIHLRRDVRAARLNQGWYLVRYAEFGQARRAAENSPMIHHGVGCPHRCEVPAGTTDIWTLE